MSRKVKRKVNRTDIILILTVVLLLIVVLVICVKFFSPNDNTPTLENAGKINYVKSEKEEIVVPKDDQELIIKLSQMKERDRLEYYCGQYIKKVEQKEYEKAYNLLYPEFKENYFPTLEKYKEYIDKTYPENFAVEYDDISRQGNIYVLRLKILDVLGSKEDEKIQRIVIRENDYNNFVLSFQVI